MTQLSRHYPTWDDQLASSSGLRVRKSRGSGFRGGGIGKVFRLTQRTVEAAVCPSGRKDALLFDRETRGFGLRVTAAGSKLFLARYQGATGKRRVAIGPFGVLTVEEARKRAKAILGDAAQGRDPFRAAGTQRSTLGRSGGESAGGGRAFTFGKLIDAWERARAGDRRASYLAIAAAAMRKHFAAWAIVPPTDHNGGSGANA